MCKLSCLTGAASIAAMFVVAAHPRTMTAESRACRGNGTAPAPKSAREENPSPGKPKDASQAPVTTKPAPPCRVSLLDDEAAWEKLPAVEQTAGRRLPHWARALAGALPRTTAAMLHLDYLYRTSAAIDPKLRARMRWVAARANRCEYAQEYAQADLLRAGATRQEVEQLEAGVAELPPTERAALSFARKMTLAASTVTDDEMQSLVDKFGEPTVVAMVLQLAYANFQDRLLLTLGVSVEEGGPLAPLEVLFAPPPPDWKPQPAERPPLPESTPTVAPEKISDPEWTSLTFLQLQELMEAQRSRTSRISVPVWETFRAELDPQLYPPDRPTRIKWSLVVLGHQPRLGSAWFNCLRTFGKEANQDRVFEETLFWVITRSLQCFY